MDMSKPKEWNEMHLDVPQLMGIPNQALFTLKETAKIFKVHVRTIERWIEGERLPAIVLPGGKSLRIPHHEIVKVFSHTTTIGDTQR